MQKRRSHTLEFKKAAVRRWEDVRNFNQVGRELDVSANLIRRWRDQLDNEGESAFPGKGHLSDAETTLMKRENARLREENAILKKAIGYFSDRPR